jgi:hypothetical protein
LYNEDNGENVWQNARPSSTLHCIPIKFGFVEEIEVLIQLEVAAIKAEISNLNKFECTLADSTVFVRFDMNFTMIDGKICNAFYEKRASQRCYICNATLKVINDPTKIYSRPAGLFFIPKLELFSVCCTLHTI